jgi:thiamine-phosphate pyrophosphorylase
MDQRLVAWARAVKARRRRLQPSGMAMRERSGLPVLWLFTDARRLPDPLPAASRLPRGLAGVVLRHDDEPGRAALGRALARICRVRRLTLVVAGDVRLARALGAGVHLRGGRWPSPLRAPHRLVTSSAHGVAELRRARGAGASLAFVSPAFLTRSHPGARALGPVRWARLARAGGNLAAYALGGVDGASARRLPRSCSGAGAIAGAVDHGHTL